MCAVAAAGGEAELLGAESEGLSPVSEVLLRSGCRIEKTDRGIYLCRKGRLSSCGDPVRTGPHPCFPTDAQPLVSSVMASARGTTVFEENMFENRFAHMKELSRMGAKIDLRGKYAVVEGVERLSGRTVVSHDLRGGAALVVAGLGAQGETRILDAGYIDRGYENIEKTLTNLGADAERVRIEADKVE